METTQETKWGEIHISQRVLAKLTAQIAIQIPEVAAMGSNFIEAAMEKTGRRLPGRGVDLRIEGQKIEVTLRLVLYYGSRIPDVALTIQKKVKEKLEDRTGCEVTAVHLVITDLDFSREAAYGI